MVEHKHVPDKADAKIWSEITRRWASAGGESLAALSASLQSSTKSNPLGRLKPEEAAEKAR